MIRRPPRSTQSRSSAASDVYKRQCVCVFQHHDIGIGHQTGMIAFWVGAQDNRGTALPTLDHQGFVTHVLLRDVRRDETRTLPGGDRPPGELPSLHWLPRHGIQSIDESLLESLDLAVLNRHQRNPPEERWPPGESRTFKVFSQVPGVAAAAKTEIGRLCAHAAALTAMQHPRGRHVQHLILLLSPWVLAKGYRLGWARWMTDSWDAQMGHPTTFEEDELLVLVQDQKQENHLAIWVFLRETLLNHVP